MKGLRMCNRLLGYAAIAFAATATTLAFAADLPHSRLGYPRSGLSRSDFVRWPIATTFAGFTQVSFRGKSRRDLLIVSIAARDP
jgi:hypothetical protein